MNLKRTIRLAACFLAVFTTHSELLAQSAAPEKPLDCETVRIQRDGSQPSGSSGGGINWLDFTNSGDEAEQGDDFVEGCLIDTEGVEVGEVVDPNADENAPELLDFVESNEKIHEDGTQDSGDVSQESTYQPEEADESFIALVQVFIAYPVLAAGLALLALVILIAFFAFILPKLFSSGQIRDRRRVCCIPARLEMDGENVFGDLRGLGSRVCLFVPSQKSKKAQIVSFHQQLELPDANLYVDEMKFPVVPDQPGTRFTPLFFISPLTKSEQNKLIKLSDGPTRWEKKSSIIRPSKERDDRISARRARLAAEEAAIA